MEQVLKTVNDNPVRTIPPYRAGLWEGESEDSNDAMKRQTRDGMGWRFATLGNWSNEKIFETLNGLGIAADPERFRAEALRYRSVDALTDAWSVNIDEGDLWLDFPLFAANELWPRLAADIPAPEMAAAAIEKCDYLLYSNWAATPELRENITQFLDYMQEVSPESMPDRLENLKGLTISGIGYICNDVIKVLKAGDLDLARRIFDVYSLAAPGSEPPLFGALALVLARAGRVGEAREYLDRQIAVAPDSLDTCQTAFDVAVELNDGNAMVKYAVEILNREEDCLKWDVLSIEIRQRFAERGEMDRYQSVMKQSVRPPEPVVLDWAQPSPVPQIEPARSSSVVGRNDPCPCGSGKKYKKCCGG